MSPRLYADQSPALWRFGPVTVADHTRDDSLAAIAARILRDAPPRFALAGLSMGGYIAFEILRQASARVAKLALLDTQAQPDTAEQSVRRRQLAERARAGAFAEVVDELFPNLVHPAHRQDAALLGLVRQMGDETGPEAFARQEAAIIGRPDSRPDLSAISCPTLVLVGDGDALTPPDRAREMAAAIPSARLMVVPDCGHLSTLEQPTAVTQALVGWIQA